MNTPTEVEKPQTVADLQKAINQLKFQQFLAKPKLTDEQIEQVRANTKKAKYSTINGLTIYGLRKAGFSVSVVHIRMVSIPGVKTLVPINSFSRGAYTFYGKGGACHVTLTDREGTNLLVSSFCHPIDNYDYKLGVKIALDNIVLDMAKQLLETGLIPRE